MAACFYLAFLELYPQLSEADRAAGKLTLPPWGMLTGVRPDKPVTWALMEGKTPEEAKSYLKTHYFVPEERAALALETGTVDFICTDMPTAMGAVAAYPDMKILDFTDSDDNFEVDEGEINIGISVMKGNTELKEAIDSVLSTMTADDFNTLMNEAIAIQPLSE